MAARAHPAGAGRGAADSNAGNVASVPHPVVAPQHPRADFIRRRMVEACLREDSATADRLAGQLNTLINGARA
jgi:hypothetical protein